MTLNQDIPSAPIHFFDLDETITDADTDNLWVQWRMKKGPMGYVEKLMLNRVMRDYKIGRMDIGRYIRYHRIRIGLKNPSEFEAMARQFYQESGRSRVRPGMAELIGGLKKHGSKIVVITAQDEVIARPFADDLGCDALFGNRFELKRNGYGPAVKPYCFKEGKIFWAEGYASSLGFKLEACAFYSDSINDLPILSVIGYPVCVNPDPLLEDRAEREGWRILRY